MRSPIRRRVNWSFVGLLLAAMAVWAPRSVSADVVHSDDVIIQGSLAVGFDAVNGEVFGFDTIRLKENNLRIKFQDTSSSAAFPTQDWQLTANATSNGGGEFFSIDAIDPASSTPFKVETAPTNSFFLKSNGHLGLGTGTPVVDLHIVSGNTPTMRLDQDGSSGFTPQVWDVAGNEANFFIRDTTNGSKLVFRILPNAPTSSIHILANGNVGLGTSSAAERLDVQGKVNLKEQLTIAKDTTSNVSTIRTNDTNSIMDFVSDRSIASAVSFRWADAAGGRKMVLTQDSRLGIGVNSVGAANSIEHANGARLTTGGVWTDASSRALKEDINNLSTDEARQVLAQLNPVKFRYKRQPDEQYVGFIAEDVPDLVATGDRKGLSAMDVAAVVTKVVQQQQQTIDSQREKIDQLTERLVRLESARETEK